MSFVPTKKSTKRKLLDDFNTITDIIIKDDNRFEPIYKYVSDESKLISLEIITNNSINTISDSLINLRELYLYDTFVEKVLCNSLKHINIEKNYELKYINQLRNLVSLNLNKCDSLRQIDNDNVKRITVKNCIRLESIKNTLRLERLYIYYCPRLTSIHSSMHLTDITLYKCDSIKQLFGFPNITHLTISDCTNLSHISNLSNVKYLQIINCKKLNSIKSVTYIDRAYINSCEQLTDISQIISIMHLELVGTHINKFHNVSIHTLKMSYNVTSSINIKSAELTEVYIYSCTNIQQLHIISPKLNYIEIKNCERLTDIVFNIKETYKNAVLTLLGPVNIKKIISDCLIGVTIKNNHLLEKIDSTKCIKDLFIENCPELVSISNISSIEKIGITNCKRLQLINNIDSVRCLCIKQCEHLLMIPNSLTNLKIVIIERCPKLIFTISSIGIYSIDINDSNLILFEITPIHATHININKTAILDNINNYQSLCYKLGHINTSVQLIQCMIRRYIIQKYKNRAGIIDTKRIPTCNICLSEIDEFESKSITMCFHQFHTSCIRKWLNESYTCPVCKNPVVF